MKKELFQVEYIGEDSFNFKKGHKYKVIEIDEDGDYVLMDDFYNEIQHYKNKFKIIS